eukprot:Phypoly_transcript_20404.p1 GENE.Phypoly_transcript_20404~~Phypoly_transcript_20404.p1  ORF type:complete len:203 (+),score=47.63 Phypoly_transcript_20404:86-610(+)
MTGDPDAFNKTAFADAFSEASGIPEENIQVNISVTNGTSSKRAVDQSFTVSVYASQTVVASGDTSSLSVYNSSVVKANVQAALTNPNSSLSHTLVEYTVSNVTASSNTILTQPTFPPTQAPTQVPTKTPTKGPTNAPPTLAPTDAPTTTGQNVGTASSITISFFVFVVVLVAIL